MTAALSAGGTTSDQDILFFRQEVNTIRKRLNDLLSILPSLDRTNQQQQLVSNKCTFKDIGTELTNLYTLALTRGQWPPAHQTKDQKAPTAYTLKPSNMNQSPVNMSEVTCYHCGEKGHYKRDCPKLKMTGTNPGPTSDRRNGGRGGHGGRGGKAGRGMFRSRVTAPTQPSWRVKAPKAGEPETQERNGKRFYWCAHCERWTGTHGTSGHTNDKTRKNLPPQGNICTPCTLAPSEASWGITQPLPSLSVAPSAWKERVTSSVPSPWPSPWIQCALTFVLGLFFRPSDLCSVMGLWLFGTFINFIRLLGNGIVACVSTAPSFVFSILASAFYGPYSVLS